MQLSLTGLKSDEDGRATSDQSRLNHVAGLQGRPRREWGWRLLHDETNVRLSQESLGKALASSRCDISSSRTFEGAATSYTAEIPRRIMGPDWAGDIRPPLLKSEMLCYVIMSCLVLDLQS